MDGVAALFGAAIGFGMIALFMAAQGGAIFATALVARRLLRGSGAGSKITAMVASWTAWIAVTIAGYTALGGEGGLMDGALMLLFLCFLSIFSTAAYAVLWLAVPAWRRHAAGEI